VAEHLYEASSLAPRLVIVKVGLGTLPPKYLLLSIAIVEIALFDTIFVQVKVVAKGLDV
jgi:hypothetical protein